MDISNIKNVGSRLVGRGVLTVKKYSPEILTAGAIVGVVGTAVLASKATLKAAPEFRALQDEVAELKSPQTDVGYSDEELRKLVAKTYIHGIARISKMYLPAASTAVAASVCVLSAHGIMKRRNVAIAMAYKTLETTFNEYRERVVEEIGVERERDVRHGYKVEEVIDEETGKKKKVPTVSDDAGSLYSRMFDERNVNWQGEPDYNDLFLRTQQNYANDMLRIRGHVTLNDVFDRLGIDRVPEGQLVGWVWQGEGDNYIDFGLDEFQYRDQGVWNLPGEIKLNFNVDGYIYEMIK